MAANTHSFDLESSSSQVATAADSASLSITGDMSGACWVNFESLPSSGNRMCMFAKWEHTGSNKRNYDLALNNNSGTYELWWSHSSDGTWKGSSAVTWNLSDGTWYHVAVTVDVSGSITFYVDGSQQGSPQASPDTSGIQDSDRKFCIGAEDIENTPTSYFDGKIDEMVITSDLMSAQEISDLNSGWVATEKVDNIAAYWKLNNAYTDDSGNSNTLTGVNSPTFSTTVPFANYAAAAAGGNLDLTSKSW